MFTLNITSNILVADGVGFPIDYCCNGHSLHKIQQMIIWASTNSLLNNFCQKENDLVVINMCNSNNGKKKKENYKLLANEKRIHYFISSCQYIMSLDIYYSYSIYIRRYF